ISPCERNMTPPPNSRIPTSKLTRVRVEGLLKRRAQIWPCRGLESDLPRVALYSRADSKRFRISARVSFSIERKCFIGDRTQPDRQVENSASVFAKMEIASSISVRPTLSGG